MTGKFVETEENMINRGKHDQQIAIKTSCCNAASLFTLLHLIKNNKELPSLGEMTRGVPMRCIKLCLFRF